MHFWKNIIYISTYQYPAKAKLTARLSKIFQRFLKIFIDWLFGFYAVLTVHLTAIQIWKKNDIKSGVSVIFTLKAVWEFRESRIGPQYKVRSNEKYFQSWLQKPCLKWHAIDPSLLKGCQAKAKYFSPSPEKVRFPYDWNIFDNKERTKV